MTAVIIACLAVGFIFGTIFGAGVMFAIADRKNRD